MAAYNTNTLASLYRKARGIGENALSMLTSGFAEPAAGYAAAAAAATGYDAEGARNAIRERMTYAPKTAEGVRYMSELARVMSAVNNSAPVTTWKKGVDIAGRYSPTAGAVLATVPTAIGVATGAKPASQQGRSISMLAQRMQDGMVRNAMIPRVLHPQRGAVIVDGDLKRIADFRKKDDVYQFENSEEFYSALNDFVEKNSANDAFEGMILPTGHGEHNGFLMITPSTKKDGYWQVTHTDKNYMPISDEGIQTKSQALESFAKYGNPELWHE